MKPSVAIDLHLFLLAEGRSDVLTARPSARTVILAAGLWDLLDAGICWGVGERHLKVVGSPTPELAPLGALYDVVQSLGTARPALIWRTFFDAEASEPSAAQSDVAASSGKRPSVSRLPADRFADDVVRHLRRHQNLSPQGLAVPAPVFEILVQRVREAALAPYTNATDGALLLALNRCTFLRDRYFHGRSEKLALRNRLRDMIKQPPRAGGWTMEGLLKNFLLYDQRPFGYLR